MITIADINLLLNKYCIGPTVLSSLLGWGRGTILRYLKGDIPSKEYSYRLQVLLKEPIKMKELLESNENQITEIAYKKSIRAINLLLVENI